MKQLLRTTDIASIAFAKALLDGEGIDEDAVTTLTDNGIEVDEQP